ncbi:MAG: hypothetical protein M1837_003082 [Sclerophora amabilis]|nr:MAG: hypothetical protein M1837_003082 [Sclerophora amabilis]
MFFRRETIIRPLRRPFTKRRTPQLQLQSQSQSQQRRAYGASPGRRQPGSWGTQVALGVLGAGAGAGAIAAGSYYFYDHEKRHESPWGEGSDHPRPGTEIGTGIGLQWKGKAVPALSLAEATAKLREEEMACMRLRDGVGGFHAVRVASNSPVEDEMVYAVEEVDEGGGEEEEGGRRPDASRLTYRRGWATSATLRDSLVPFVSRELRSAFAVAKEEATVSTTAPESRRNPRISPTAIDRAIKAAFLSLDKEIIEDGNAAIQESQSQAEVVSRQAPGYAGSCGLLSVFDPHSSVLRVACVGDSRAVLGRKNPDGKWEAEPLSEDQTGFNEAEYARVTADHPGETDVVSRDSGRVLGIAVTRAFGDGLWKWPLETINVASKRFWGRDPRPGYQTPPYLTAEPVISTTKIQSGKDGDFLIMATDGVWDHISSQHAVECVGQWIQARRAGTLPEKQRAVRTHNTVETGQRPVGYSSRWKVTPGDFVVEDENAATHLARNVLGGKNRDLFCGAMSATPPLSRNVRDDLTVQVVFFGDI